MNEHELSPTPMYSTIAEAEAAIVAAGYVRDAVQHIWVQRDTGKKCKVVRGDDNANSADKNNSQFFVQSA